MTDNEIDFINRLENRPIKVEIVRNSCNLIRTQLGVNEDLDK